MLNHLVSSFANKQNHVVGLETAPVVCAVHLAPGDVVIEEEIRKVW